MTRDELIRRLRRLATKRRVELTIDRRGGKGGHWLVTYGALWQAVPQNKGRDLPIGTLRSIIRGLGLKREDLE